MLFSSMFLNKNLNPSKSMLVTTFLHFTCMGSQPRQIGFRTFPWKSSWKLLVCLLDIWCISFFHPPTHKDEVLISSMINQRILAHFINISEWPSLDFFLSLKLVFSVSIGTSPQEWHVAPPMRAAIRFCEARHWNCTPDVQCKFSSKNLVTHLMHSLLPVPGGASNAIDTGSELDFGGWSWFISWASRPHLSATAWSKRSCSFFGFFSSFCSCRIQASAADAENFEYIWILRLLFCFRAAVSFSSTGLAE